MRAEGEATRRARLDAARERSQQTLASLGRDLDQASAEARGGLRANTEQLAGSSRAVSWEGGCAREATADARPFALVATAGRPGGGGARLCIRWRGRARDRLGPPADLLEDLQLRPLLRRAGLPPAPSRWRSSSRPAGRPSPASSPTRPGSARRRSACRPRWTSGSPALESEIVDPARAPAAGRRARTPGPGARQGEAEAARLLAQLDQEAERRVDGGAHPARPRGGRDRRRAGARAARARAHPADRERIFARTLERLRRRREVGSEPAHRPTVRRGPLHGGREGGRRGAPRRSRASSRPWPSVLRRDPAFLRAFEVPSVSPDEQAAASSAASPRRSALRAEVTAPARCVMTEHLRLRFLPEVVEMFRALIDRREGLPRGRRRGPGRARPCTGGGARRRPRAPARDPGRARVRGHALRCWPASSSGSAARSTTASLEAQLRRFAASGGHQLGARRHADQG